MHYIVQNYNIIPIDSRFVSVNNKSMFFIAPQSYYMQILKRPYLGELEMAVLEHLWSNGKFDAKGVYAALGKARGISHNTIQSTLERLFKKKLLARKKVSYAYVYQTAVARDELMGQMINDVVNTISKDNADGMLAAFVDIAARTDDAHLDKLEQLIYEYRSNHGSKF